MKKKTTIRKQWIKNIMALVIGIFIVMAIGTYIVFQNLIQGIMSTAIPSIATTVTNELEKKEAIDIINESTDSEVYKKIEGSLDTLVSKSKGIIENVYIISSGKDSQWSYIIDKSAQNSAKKGDVFNKHDNKKPIDEAISSGKLIISDKRHNLIEGTTSLTAYIPIKTQENIKVVLGIDFKTDVFMKIQMIILGIMLLIMILAILIVRIIVGGIAKKQTRSIYMLVDKMKNMANLSGDLTQRIEIHSNDEIGELAEYTNEMLDTIQKVLLQVKNTANQLNLASEHFSTSFGQATEEFEQMDITTRDIAVRIEEQTKALAVTSDNVHEINSAVAQVAENSQLVTEQALRTSENAVEGNQVMNQLRDFSKEIGVVIGDTSLEVRNLVSKSETINSIVDTITGISEQTNLLALNASIEAARAGEQGRGFAVVAEEVRKLAEESSKSAEEIFNLIREVKAGIELAAASMTKIAEKTSEEDKFIIQVSERFNHIVEAINNVSSRVEEVSSATEEMSANTAIMTEKIEDLAGISEENNAATEEVAASIDNQVSSVNNLSNMIGELRDISSDLSEKLSKLKLE